ncbi:MAG: hypothetical protein HYX79_07600 [Chloroflexi bacterium]|nr:hypothetical protein [Chloroflexota bacterium]
MRKKLNIWSGMAVIALVVAIAALIGTFGGRLYASPPSGVPRVLDYQGRLTNPAGQPVADGTYSVQFSLYDAETGGNTLWSETQNVTLSGGLFNALLGSTTTLDSSIFNYARYLQFSVQGEELSPRQRMTSVPFALLAMDTESLGGNNASDYTLRSSLSIPGTINQVTNPVDWSMLKNVPAGIADGVDDTGGGAASNADTLDNLDSVQFLRSDTSATFASGTLTMGAGTTLALGNSTVTKSNTSLVMNMNADLLDGLNGIQFMRSDVDSTLPAVRRVGNLNADLLDGLNSTDFLRQDGSGTINGNLQVGGDITVSGRIAYAPQRTHYLMLGPSDFRPTTSLVQYFLDDGAYLAAGSNGSLVAPVHLPDGAVVTTVRVWYKDDLGGTITVYLRGSAIMAMMSTSPPQASNDVREMYNANINVTLATIDNTAHTYDVKADFPNGAGPIRAIHKVLITYTIAEAP